MLDLSVIILTKNEQLHIRRCLENICPIAKKVYIIDSQSTDNTQIISNEFPNVEFVIHEWPGNQSAQLNWGLENLKIDTEWILRLDADEYLMPELITELKTKLSVIASEVGGIVFKRRHIFLGKWMKHGTYPVKLLRLWRNGHAQCEDRQMDEHMMLLQGEELEFEYDFVDENLNNLSWFCQKHLGYAEREAAELMALDCTADKRNIHLAQQALQKRSQKLKYARLPLFWRSFFYFCYRYIFKLGFLDGKEGFLWHFLQGLWYRIMVDANIYEIMKQKRD